MPLTLDQQKRVATHLNTRGSTPKCPVCSASNMQVQKEVLQFPLHDAPESSRPVVGVQCGYCGFLMHFSPAVMGLDL